MLFAMLTVSSSILAMSEKIPVEVLNETVITTGESFGTKTRKIAKNIQVITAKEIKEKGARNIQEALKGVPGVIVRDYEGLLPRIDLRGNGGSVVCSSGTVVLLDGVPMNGMVNLDINTIPVEEIEKIEIIQGGGTVDYGDGSINGVVNIITKSTKNQKNTGTVGLEFSSWKTRKATLNYNTQLTDKFSLGLSYSNYSSLGYRDRSEKYKGKKDQINNIFLRTKYDLHDGYVKLNYNHTDKKDFYTGCLGEKQYHDNPKQAGRGNGVRKGKKDIWNLSISKKLNDSIEILVDGEYAKSKNKKNNNLSSEYFIKPEMKYNYAKDSYVTLGGNFQNGKIEIQKEVKVNGKMTKYPNDERKSNAFFIKNKTTFGNFQFSQGYRIEKVKYNYSEEIYNWSTFQLKEIIPKHSQYTNHNFDLGLNYLYSDSGNIYFNYTKATRTPTIGEVGIWERKGEYKIQKNNIFEIGLRDYYENTAINASVFYVTSENEIYFDQANPYDLKIKNLDGKVKRTGAQLSLRHDFDKLTLKENISYISPKIKTGIYKGNEFAGVPNWTANINVTYKFTDNLLANLDGYYQSSAYADDDFSNRYGKLNSYTTVDTNISYKLENGLEFYTGIKNIFDKKYAMVITSFESIPGVEYYPANGRSFYGGFKYTF